MKRSFVIALHIGYWILYLLLILLLMLFMQAGIIKNGAHGIIRGLMIMSIFTIIPALAGFYIFYALLFDRYLSQKRMAALCLAGLLTILMAGFTGFAGLNILTKGMILRHNGLKEISLIVSFMSILALIHGIIAMVMKGFITWYGDIKIKEQLQQQNFETELALVRSQLSPHFLFNTINNIDVLIEKDAVTASAYLNKLSDIMRFMLYETKTERIPLQKELTYIEKYIDLQKIRSANQNFVQYSTTGNTGEWMIAPMLFIPFIENAFKHSVNKRSDQTVVISITATKESLSFYCGNRYTEKQAGKETGGLGNALIQKRLNLLYPGRHSLKTAGENNVYKVHLSIYRNED